MSDPLVKPQPASLARIPFSQRASLWGDLRIAWRALLGALRQLPRSRHAKHRRRT